MPRHGLQARAQQLLLCLSLRFHCAHCLFPLCHPLAERRCVSIAALLIDLDGTLHKTPPSGALSASPGRGGGSILTHGYTNRERQLHSCIRRYVHTYVKTYKRPYEKLPRAV